MNRAIEGDHIPEAFVPPRWQKPAPLGYGGATDTVSTVAAPLLAGFSVATIGVVAANSHSFRWSGIALFALTAAAILMVASLQFGFHARQHLYFATDIRDWWTVEDLNESRIARLQRQQKEDFQRWLNWSAKRRFAYNAGIVTLALGIAATLVPEPGRGVQESSAAAHGHSARPAESRRA